ncbi:HAD hydrolase-like protein [Actinomycetospora sp. TBRC 11914]|uniref:HAD hydrolase-like protein n=1 Tax=Actinomycetospora sp. TBRC 11914 TaxID=2729387 RepID=UPI00145F77B2|nr:HAD hydrolase-like protein [Actinomycetospora sp. TBRC 11914]NMO89839.1 HAD hydrolase-like protein [Actinomycetospora sp. TBRC 11914]
MPSPTARSDSRLVLFDLDGTLVDSGPGIRASIRHATTAVGLPEPTPEQLRDLIGPPFPAAFRDVLGVDVETAEVMMAAYRQHYGGGAMFDVEPYEGIPEALEDLAARGDVLAVTTSKPAGYAREIVEHLGLTALFAGGVHGAAHDGSVEGKAAVVGLALTQHANRHADGSMAGLVGDRHHDVEGARHHDLPCVGVSWGFGGRAELEAAGAVAVVDKPAEIAAALDDLG